MCELERDRLNKVVDMSGFMAAEVDMLVKKREDDMNIKIQKMEQKVLRWNRIIVFAKKHPSAVMQTHINYFLELWTFQWSKKLNKRDPQKYLGKYFTMEVCMQNMWEKGYVEMNKLLQWHPDNDIKIAIPA